MLTEMLGFSTAARTKEMAIIQFSESVKNQQLWIYPKELLLQMQGYTLKDAANHIYTFGNFTLSRGATVRLYTGQGQNSPTALYWGLANESVWNNDHDSAFLRDNQGALVDVFSY